MSLLLLIAILGPSFDVTPDICMEVRTIEQEMLYIKDVAAEIAESNVELEPVYNFCTKWPSLVCAHVESCHLLPDGTQDETYFK